ncbi:MnhB domain-containing protein [Variovorax sp. V512]|uniref:MnhB domain-containing protein n=1 Tax=Variovorax sp. V512 TaxID=3064160 RepID=UPI0034E87266
MALPIQQRLQVDDGSSDLLNPRRATDSAIGYLMVPAVLVRLVLPVAVLVSVYFFMRGHNAPGGGFVAGLVMSVALVLQFIVSGTEWVEEHLRIYPRRWIAIGLLFALATGGGAIVFGYPFLTSTLRTCTCRCWATCTCQRPLLRHRRVRVVLGATMLILTALAHQSIRSHRWADEQEEKEAQARAAAEAEEAAAATGGAR